MLKLKIDQQKLLLSLKFYLVALQLYKLRIKITNEDNQFYNYINNVKKHKFILLLLS